MSANAECVMKYLIRECIGGRGGGLGGGLEGSPPPLTEKVSFPNVPPPTDLPQKC